MDGEHAAHKYEKKNLSNNMPQLHLAAISVSEWPQNATCGENKDRRKQKNRPARLTIEKSERVASCHDGRASVQTCDNGHVLLACFFEKNVWDFFFCSCTHKNVTLFSNSASFASKNKT